MSITIKVKFIFVYVLLTDFVLNLFSKIIYIYIRENIFNIQTIFFLFFNARMQGVCHSLKVKGTINSINHSSFPNFTFSEDDLNT